MASKKPTHHHTLTFPSDSPNCFYELIVETHIDYSGFSGSDVEYVRFSITRKDSKHPHRVEHAVSIGTFHKSYFVAFPSKPKHPES